jgi:DNA polymerase-3 subunit delta'
VIDDALDKVPLLIQKPLAWHVDALQQLNSQMSQRHLAHAYLLAGEADTGKRHFATLIAHALLCSQRQELRACGECAGCKLNNVGTHPDLYVVEPLAKSKRIAVDQIRELKHFLETSAHAFGQRVIILDSAENLGIASANALLKGLEEPPQGVVFLLLSDRPKSVLPTISSRAQTLRLAKPSKDQSLAWLCTELDLSLEQATLLLELAMYRPLGARFLHESGMQDSLSKVASGLLSLSTLQENPTKLAKDLAKTGTADTLRIMLLWLSTLIKAQMSGDGAHLQNEAIQQLAINLKLSQNFAAGQAKRLFSLYNEVAIAQLQFSSGSNPNAQLMLEDLFIQFQQLAKNNGQFATA